jgi:DNA-binding transcriptional LysR family regulator
MAPKVRRRPLRKPKLEELELFCATAELGGVGRAAVRLHISQPAASKRLAGLEALVGTPLFERTPHGVTLTPAGQRLYAQARLVLAQLEGVVDLIGELSGERQALRLAISHTAAECLLPKALVSLHQRDSLPVEVLSANSHVVKQMVREGAVDLGVAGCLLDERPEDLGMAKLMEDRVVFAVPLGHPWARRKRITLAELKRTPVIQRDPSAHTRQVLERALGALGEEPLAVAVEVGSTQAAKEEAHALNLPTLLSALAVSPADLLEVVEVEGLELRRYFCALYLPPVPSPPAAELIEALKASAAALEAARAAKR